MKANDHSADGHTAASVASLGSLEKATAGTFWGVEPNMGVSKVWMGRPRVDNIELKDACPMPAPTTRNWPKPRRPPAEGSSLGEQTSPHRTALSDDLNHSPGTWINHDDPVLRDEKPVARHLRHIRCGVLRQCKQDD